MVIFIYTARGKEGIPEVLSEASDISADMAPDLILMTEDVFKEAIRMAKALPSLRNDMEVVNICREIGNACKSPWAYHAEIFPTSVNGLA